MNTQFFNQIAQMNIEGNLQINIQTTEENTLIVSVFLQNESCGDKAKNLITPLVLKGTAEELDNGFFKNIVQPIEQTSTLMVEMENYLKSQEQAKQNSVMEKAKAEVEKKQKQKQKQKFDKAVEKAELLKKEGKFREAWTVLPDVKDFPDFADVLRQQKQELEKEFAPSLFE